MPKNHRNVNEEYLPLINMKPGSDKRDFRRAPSVITDPQLSIFQSIEENDLEFLTALLTDEQFITKIDLNHVYEEQKGQTLLHTAIENENLEAVRLLVSSGASCTQFNKANHTSLHVAARKGQIGTMQILMGSGKVDVNAAVEGSNETILHILARKADKSNFSYNVYIECLKYALRSPGVNVDAIEKTASMTPLFIATDESKSKEAATALIKAGAEVNLNIDGIDLRQALIKTFGPEILNFQPSNLEDAIKGLEVGNRSRLLRLLNESVIRDTFDEFKAELDQLGCAEDIGKSAPGVYNLLQVACENGLPKHLEAMLEIEGVDVNACSESTEPGLLIAAKNAQGDVLKTLLNHGKTEICIYGDMGTILHYILNTPLPHRPQKDYELALQQMLSSGSNLTKFRSIINLKDKMGNTALHLATQFWPQSVVKSLLELGANIGLKNNLQEVPINRILPETMEDFLNNVCMETQGDPTNDKFKITTKFDFLVPFGTNLNSNSGTSQNKVNDATSTFNPMQEEIPLPETEGLWYMSQSEKNWYLLKHPVIATFLWMKWKKIRCTYYRNLILYLAFVAFITSYIFVLYSGKAVRSDSVIGKECSTETVVKGDVTFLWIATTICWVYLIAREFLQFGIAPKRYIFTLENWAELALIAMTSFLLFDGYSCNIEAKRHVSAFVIVLSWSEMIVMIGRHPRLTEVNIYVTMLFKVLWTFIKFLTWYCLFIFAFALGFYILLHKDDGTTVSGENDYVFFDKFGLTIIKTFTMFVGELEFGDLPIKTGVGYLFLLTFVFLIVVVLMNLLNGLAVSDTGVIRAEAETYAYKSQVELIAYTESILLGDPFNFLANWPSWIWLRRVPNFSMVGGGRLYKVPQLREVFHKITGARDIMLFQGTKAEHPKGFCVSFMPNQEYKYINYLCSCCGSNDSDSNTEETVLFDLPEVLAESAKETVVENLRLKAEEAEKLQLESRLENIESILYQLLKK